MPSVYKPLKIYFSTYFISCVLLLSQYIIPFVFTIIFSFCVLFLNIYSSYKMRVLSNQLKKFFYLYIISITILVFSSIFASYFLISKNFTIAILSVLMLFSSGIIYIISQYYCFYGLEIVAKTRNYKYQSQKIYLVFYISFFNNFVTTTLLSQNMLVQSLVFDSVCRMISLWLIYEYLQVAKEQENNTN